MTISRLLELYQAEQQGKQIMMNSIYYGYFEHSSHTIEIKISEVELKDLVLDNENDVSYTFYIKDEEDKYGCKLENYDSERIR